jgi:hypothetical protein
VARHGVAAAGCAVSGCPHQAAGYDIVRGWGNLCTAHVEIRWRYLRKGRQRFYLRRYRQRMRAATAAERAARRAMMRKLDGTEGRHRRREVERAKTGQRTRAEADAARRAMCAESERQTKPEKALGISRSTYLRRKVGTPEVKPMGRPRKSDAMTAAERKRLSRQRESTDNQYVTKSLTPGKRRQFLSYSQKQASSPCGERGAAQGERKARERLAHSRVAPRLLLTMRNAAGARLHALASKLLSARTAGGESPHRFAGGHTQIRQPVRDFAGAAP